MSKAVEIKDKWDIMSLFIDDYIPYNWVCCFYYNHSNIKLDCYLTTDLIEMYEADPKAFRKALFSIKEFQKAIFMPKYEFIPISE